MASAIRKIPEDEQEIAPRESWLDRDDPRFGAEVDAEEAPTSLREWASISARLTKDALEVLFENERVITINATVLSVYDHRDKAFDLADEGVLELHEHSFEYAGR